MKLPRPGQIYEGHRRHNWYEVIYLAEDAETMEANVIYRQIRKENEDSNFDEDKVYVRSLKSFMEELEVNGTKIHRFIEVKKC